MLDEESNMLERNDNTLNGESNMLNRESNIPDEESNIPASEDELKPINMYQPLYSQNGEYNSGNSQQGNPQEIKPVYQQYNPEQMNQGYQQYNSQGMNVGYQQVNPQILNSENQQMNTRVYAAGMQAGGLQGQGNPNQTEKKVKKKWKDRMKENVHNFLMIIREYPITISCIFLATVLGTIVFDAEFSDTVMENVYRVIMFALIFALGSLLTEEIFRRNKLSSSHLGITKYWLFKGSLLAVSAALSVLFVYVFSSEDYVFGIKKEAAENILTAFSRILMCYCVIMFVMSMYLMYKRLKESFERYCIDVFSTLIKTSVVYGLFALGIAAIIAIFNVLILDTADWSVLEKLEIFLAGGIYVPAIIIVISKKREEIGKFAKIVVEYVLLPLLIAAFVIIYLYLLKLLFNQDMPSNEVFPIISWLFMCGLPIWTMARHFEEQVLGKIAKFLPFAYIPFVILQVVCLGIRVADYGLTVTRCCGFILILLECIYIGIYCYKCGKLIHYIVPVSLIILVLAVVIPGTNVFSIVTNSQGKRMEEMLAKGGELSPIDKNEIGSIYRELYWNCSMEGDAFLDSHYTEDERDEMYNWYYDYDEYGNGDQWHYRYSHTSIQSLDISEYKSMVRVFGRCYDKENFDTTEFELFLDYENSSEVIYIDITEVVEYLMEYESTCLEEKNMYDVGDGRFLFVTSISGDIWGDEYKDVSVDGYLFETN